MSPYEGLPIEQWRAKTIELIERHPIPSHVLVSSIINSWDLIQGTQIGEDIIVGVNYFPTPQILGDFLHELIPIELSKYNADFRKGVLKSEKDITCDSDAFYSIEIKTSSQKSIYGNRSYAQQSSRSSKDKSGYYLAINFAPIHTLKEWKPIQQIRFGWLDSSDWQGQRAATGQQANLSSAVLNNKLITLYQSP